ncbi:hypothetical protein [Microseira sp. BLCC-F43]|jgi:hypothetical protein|uniref:hypothetical protein n=1 Tax=Microseira sp. BLCC-F43 TaxID=3153602 RepID=UPI0035B87833
MHSNLHRLKLAEKELENLICLEVNNVLMLDIFPMTISQILRHPQRLFSLCLAEVLIFGLILVVVFTLGLLLARNSGQSFEDTYNIFRFLQVAVVISLMVTLGCNLYLWIKAKNFLALRNLLDEVNKYNELIEAVDIVERLEAVSQSELNLMNRDTLIAALEVTRESLIAALSTEKLLRENKGLIARRYEVFSYLENNLTNLMALDTNNKAGEYGRLLNESLQIGMSVHKEVRKLQKRQVS